MSGSSECDECCIIINSCLNFYEKTVPILLETLQKAAVPNDRIFVVIGESESDRSEIINGIHYIFRRYCTIDNNGLLWITQEQADHPELNTKWIFYIHDTCFVHHDFWKRSLDIMNAVDENAHCIMLQNQYSMGIGFYKLEWLYTDDVKLYMSSKINYDPNNKSKIKWDPDTEDTLFKYAKRTNKNVYSLENCCKVIDNNKNIYGTNTQRMIEYWEIPGIYKMKANWPGIHLHTNL